MYEIKDLTELQRLQKEAVGYIVITDKPTSSARLHRADCPHVSTTNFETKVLINGGENGGYYWSVTIEEAKDRFQPSPCQVCARSEIMTVLNPGNSVK